MARLFAIPSTDIHTATAIALFGPEEGPKRRREGKGANFAVIFGAGAPKVAAAYNLSVEAAAEVLRQHRSKFPRLQEAAREVIKRWTERGYIVLPYGKRTWRKPSDTAFFAGWNYLIQGAEGTIIQKAMLDMDAAGLDVRSQVHDKLYIDVPPGVSVQEVAQEAARIMAEAVPAGLSSRTTPPITMPADLHVNKRQE
jgi:DNA polymerase I-like protein with 3'-5' exonuclease and polymerase domains